MSVKTKTYPRNSRLFPTRRTYTPGVIPETEFVGQNGTVQYIRFGNVPTGSKLQLYYENITEDQAFDILELYDEVIRGDFLVNISKSHSTLGDADPNGMAAMLSNEDTGLLYRYAKPPTVEARLSRRYNVTVDFVGVLPA